MEQETRLQEQELGYLYTLKLQECIDNLNKVLSAICSIALDNPDEDAYKIIADYKNS